MRKYTLIIAEDEAIIALGLKTLLERAGFIVTHIAYSAEEAIRDAREDRPDVIIMDVLLNGDETGIDAAETINGEFKIPILFITGNSQLVDENSFKNIDRFIIMSKPPYEEEIIRNVRILAAT